LKQKLVKCTEKIVVENSNLVREVQDNAEDVIKKVEAMVTDGNNEQMKMNKAVIDSVREKKEEIMKEESNDVKAIINEKNEELLSEINELNESVKGNDCKLIDL
jgi:hypothetical protein